MSEANSTSDCGYGKPPQHTRFAKGQSGNPKGRPKGSQNLATILAKAGRQRIRVTENGRSRYITKFEASMLQLMNKAVSGDLKAIRELLCWIKSLENSEQTAPPSAEPHENDKAVMTSLLERIRRSEEFPADSAKDSTATDPSRSEE
ncbi:MAG TPA: DUF5681 domain-containing protein [Edaphobacter sp.]|uniref:DUF5681 domain-containing protein n=1 Tax=Edaphobacter sp. TaxID=1934404 RepID=UPI002C278191|nr:DUF5681 domain-containing protein [Edaphobacter sp.]HUZ93738.1 DUF5681 domain-containing protein [Edaphobacter sp.]